MPENRLRLGVSNARAWITREPVPDIINAPAKLSLLFPPLIVGGLCLVAIPRSYSLIWRTTLPLLSRVRSAGPLVWLKRPTSKVVPDLRNVGRRSGMCPLCGSNPSRPFRTSILPSAAIMMHGSLLWPHAMLSLPHNLSILAIQTDDACLTPPCLLLVVGSWCVGSTPSFRKHRSSRSKPLPACQWCCRSFLRLPTKNIFADVCYFFPS